MPGTELAHYQVGDPIRHAVFRNGAKVVMLLTTNQRFAR